MLFVLECLSSDNDGSNGAREKEVIAELQMAREAAQFLTNHDWPNNSKNVANKHLALFMYSALKSEQVFS